MLFFTKQGAGSCSGLPRTRSRGRCAYRQWWIVGLSTPSPGFTFRCSPRGVPRHIRLDETGASSNADLRGLQLASSETRPRLAIPADHHPLLGFVTNRPSIVQQRAVHSPPSLPRTFGVPVPAEHVTFHPRGFSPPRRLSPARCLQVYCTLHPILGFETFPASLGERIRQSNLPGLAITLRRLPLVGSRAASPRPLPPWRLRRGTPDPLSSESTSPFPHKKLEPCDHHYSLAPRC